MQLLEVINFVKFGGRRLERRQRYILYSRDATIAWDDDYSRQATYRQRAELLALIERRAGLCPRAYK